MDSCLTTDLSGHPKLEMYVSLPDFTKAKHNQADPVHLSRTLANASVFSTLTYNMELTYIAPSPVSVLLMTLLLACRGQRLHHCLTML